MVAFMTPRTPIDVEVVSPERPLEAKQRRRGTIWRDLPLKLSTPEVLSRKRNSPLDITGQLTREAYGKSEPTSKGITAHADTSEDKHVRKPSVQRPSSALRSSAYVPVGVTYGRHRLLIASVTVPEDTEMHSPYTRCTVYRACQRLLAVKFAHRGHKLIDTVAHQCSSDIWTSVAVIQIQRYKPEVRVYSFLSMSTCNGYGLPIQVASSV